MKTLRTRFVAVVVAAVVVGAGVAAAGSADAASHPRAAAAGAAQLPAGFTDTVVASVPKPTAMAVTPDGRMLVTSQTGKLWVIKDGALLPVPALDLSAVVCHQVERGMLGVAVDPAFAQNGYVYIYYTFRKFGGCATFSPDAPVNRVARFTMRGQTILPSSEKVLIDGIVNYAGNHNGGYVAFGPDGMLYASVGDGGCDYTGVTGCAGANGASRLNNVLLGKVLRITRTGGIPPGNPFTGPGTARCNHGPIAVGLTCQETYMHGFRNPFRFAFDPNSKRLFVDDVGQDTWEEIDQAVKGADYGWNVREGHCAEGSKTDCGPPPAGMTNPIFDYPHTGGCAAITGGAFVPRGVWGRYRNDYLYGDYICGKIFVLAPSAAGWTSSTFASGLGAGGPVALLFAPHGSTTALYYTTYAHRGAVHVIDKV